MARSSKSLYHRSAGRRNTNVASQLAYDAVRAHRSQLETQIVAQLDAHGPQTTRQLAARLSTLPSNLTAAVLSLRDQNRIAPVCLARDPLSGRKAHWWARVESPAAPPARTPANVPNDPSYEFLKRVDEALAAHAGRFDWL